MTSSEWASVVHKVADLRNQAKEVHDGVNPPDSMWHREFKSRLYWAINELDKACLAGGKAALKAVG